MSIGEFLATILAAASIPSAITGLCIWMIQRKITKSGEEQRKREEWPEYVQPTGAHDAYHNGDKVTWNGQHYTCIASEGTACVWDPDTYPAYWQLVEDTREDGQ